MKGVFINFEGADGSGKSTAAKTLVEILKSKGYDVLLTREPGGTVVAEEIRNLLLTKRENEQVLPMTELLLFAAARAQHVEALIKPALDQGTIVISDRFSDSTFAFQGNARGYTKEVLELEEFVQKGFNPDYTLFFDVTLEESINRILKRPEAPNRLDSEGLMFKKKVFEGYQIRKNQFPERFHVIDAMQSIEMVNQQLVVWVEDVLVKHLNKGK